VCCQCVDSIFSSSSSSSSTLTAVLRLLRLSSADPFVTYLTFSTTTAIATQVTHSCYYNPAGDMLYVHRIRIITRSARPAQQSKHTTAVLWQPSCLWCLVCCWHSYATCLSGVALMFLLPVGGRRAAHLRMFCGLAGHRAFLESMCSIACLWHLRDPAGWT
jgi:hypothetical protein